MILHAETKDFPKIALLDKNKNTEYFINFNNKITVVNFWATWCAPCKKEMPSLNKLVEIVGKNNIQVIGVNVEGVTYDKAKAFLDDLKVTNFDTFFDQDLQLVKQLSLRGVPTTLLINKEGKEFARVVGSINFEDRKFIDWIKQF
ncbi:MAG: TlpA family protein disulfide reductase [Pelagibacteraceae bacterium]|nr:TlpA family protein disulfide reductase [Pelagibacteraceae bacterium]